MGEIEIKTQEEINNFLGNCSEENKSFEIGNGLYIEAQYWEKQKKWNTKRP